MFPDTRFSWEATWLMCWPGVVRYFYSSLYSFSYLSDWRRAVSSKYYNTSVPSVSTKEAVLSRLCCKEHSLLLNSYLSRVGRSENPCNACGLPTQDASRFILHCPAMSSLRRSLFGNFVSLRPLVQALGSCPASGAPWSSVVAQSLGRGRITTTYPRVISNTISAHSFL